MENEILESLDLVPVRLLGRGYHLVRVTHPDSVSKLRNCTFVRWNLPVHHSWPCSPQDTPGFVEKAAQALFRKFGGSLLQTIIAGPLDPGSPNRYFRTLASNLRGRSLQLFPPEVGGIRDAEAQDSRLPTLFCLVGKEGLFCGLQSPEDSNGFHPGGTKYIRQNSGESISRAGAKIVEALHHLRLKRPVPPAGSHWLELGASPGGMTAELLARGYRVTAVDRAPLDKRLENHRSLIALRSDAAAFHPTPGSVYDALLSDMNGEAHDAIAQVIRLSEHLRDDGLVVFTLKMAGAATFNEATALEKSVLATAEAAGLRTLARTHLTYNRHEFTLFFEKHPLSRSPELP